ncbi:Protein of unknown function DUF3505 [Fusarium oxysporum f. sp. vasinfectum]|nr:Protein of unknown function DUF3505 [Fusarium oxysporum f. sp. vasinfectum]
MVGPKYGDFHIQRNWTQSGIVVLELAQDSDIVLRLAVQEFVPSTEELESDDTRGNKMYSIPWAIANPEEATQEIRHYLHHCMGYYLDTILDKSNHLVWDIFYWVVKLLRLPQPLLLRACISPIDGLLRVQGKDHGTWNTKAARAYLESHDDHLKGLMVLCNLDGGQFARISELLTLECFNTASRERGIGLWGAKMCSITRHHKARLATNNEFYVVRFFSIPVSRLIFNTRRGLTIYRKRAFMSDLEETPSISKRPRSGLDLLLSDEVGVQPDSEESLALRVEEEVNLSTFDSVSNLSPGEANEQVEPTHDNTSPIIGPFVHLVELNLVVCLDCKTAVLARQVKTHLVDPLHRQHFTLKERRDISNQILEIPNIIKDADDLQNWKFPSPDAEPIPYLEPPLHGGLGCNSCPHIGRDPPGYENTTGEITAMF